MTTLEVLVPRDFENVATWLSSPDINRWLIPEWRDKEVSASIVAIAVRNSRNRLFLVKHGGVPCGLAALADIEPIDRTAMVWYLLGDARLSGRGITSAAVEQLVHYAFRELRLLSLYAWTMEDNAASQRVLRKVGFSVAGRLRQSASVAGRQVDRIFFDLVADEFHSEREPTPDHRESPATR